MVNAYDEISQRCDRLVRELNEANRRAAMAGEPAAAREISRPLVKAVLDFDPSFQDVIRYEKWVNIRDLARKLKGD